MQGWKSVGKVCFALFYDIERSMAHVTYYIGNDWVCIDTAWVGQN